MRVIVAMGPAPVAAGVTTRPVRALLFDLDGTLINTEVHTDAAVSVVMARYGIANFSLPHTETHGRTWRHVAETIRGRTGIDIPATQLATTLLEYWNDAVQDAQPVPGAAQAIRAAVSAGLKVAVVSSSPRAVIDHFLSKLAVGDCVDEHARIGAESVRLGKPDPECFLLAIRALAVAPAEALVFEDSQAGLLAARAAGIRSMFITCCAVDIPENSARATAIFTHYETLPPRFWEELAAGTIALAHRSFT